MAFAITAFRVDDEASMAAVRHIRQTVFCDEQGVSSTDEWDGKDFLCEHFLLMDGATAIGCARLRPYAPGIHKIERVAIVKERRGKGAGRTIMDHLLHRLKGRMAILHAQTAVEDFYKRMGFEREGEPFTEAGLAHVAMTWRS